MAEFLECVLANLVGVGIALSVVLLHLWIYES